MSEIGTNGPKLLGVDCLRQSERTASRVIDGRAIVIAIDQNQLHVLNGVGTRVWELMDGRPLADIVDAIVAEFEVDQSRAWMDVRAFAEQLVALGAVRIGSSED
jgi:hypothetical protein